MGRYSYVYPSKISLRSWRKYTKGGAETILEQDLWPSRSLEQGNAPQKPICTSTPVVSPIAFAMWGIDLLCKYYV
ncbi:hypothetical protein LIER_30531 [Lithospermum erythrorhizon]|uniref:Uncharacterized protein n=1 Tax=Lithospermum erythrorhizon TaxID=34254 RepID=A0AAV3RRN3_LITER